MDKTLPVLDIAFVRPDLALVLTTDSVIQVPKEGSTSKVELGKPVHYAVRWLKPDGTEGLAFVSDDGFYNLSLDDANSPLAFTVHFEEIWSFSRPYEFLRISENVSVFPLVKRSNHPYPAADFYVSGAGGGIKICGDSLVSVIISEDDGCGVVAFNLKKRTNYQMIFRVGMWDLYSDVYFALDVPMISHLMCALHGTRVALVREGEHVLFGDIRAISLEQVALDYTFRAMGMRPEDQMVCLVYFCGVRHSPLRDMRAASTMEVVFNDSWMGFSGSRFMRVSPSLDWCVMVVNDDEVRVLQLPVPPAAS